jgi:hypothetical protein
MGVPILFLIYVQIQCALIIVVRDTCFCPSAAYLDYGVWNPTSQKDLNINSF